MSNAVDSARNSGLRPGGGGRPILFLILGLLLNGCANTPRTAAERGRSFQFEADTIAYPNELVWEYHFDPVTQGRTTNKRQPSPTYSHHCFVVAFAAGQFFRHARFDASQPPAEESAYRRLVKEILSRNPRRDSEPAQRVVIPGYAHLREFSIAWEELLKTECGGAWKSYFQRGHWRVVMPFSRGHQEDTMRELWSQVRRGHAPIVHIICFPQLTINHALLVYGASPALDGIHFDIYDPNYPERPSTLFYRSDTRSFEFPPNPYFAGGPVNIYEIYRGWLY